MASFVAAYLVVWAAVGLYVVRLGIRQRRLERAINALQRHAEERPASESFSSKAA